MDKSLNTVILGDLRRSIHTLDVFHLLNFGYLGSPARPLTEDED